MENNQKLIWYNLALLNLVEEFAKIFLETEEVDYWTDFYVITDFKYEPTIIYIDDYFIDIWEIRTFINYNIPNKILIEWLDSKIESDWNPEINLINFYKNQLFK